MTGKYANACVALLFKRAYIEGENGKINSIQRKERGREVRKSVKGSEYASRGVAGKQKEHSRPGWLGCFVHAGIVAA